MLSCDWLSKKPILFKSFTGLTVKEFDRIYDKEIVKRHGKHEMGCLPKRKDSREQSIGAGRHFKLDAKDRFLMLLAYYRLYITCALAGFLFDLDQSNTCRYIQKIESPVRKCVPIPQKMHRLPKRLRTPKEVEKGFPGFLSFTDWQNSTYQGLRTKQEERPIIRVRKKYML